MINFNNNIYNVAFWKDNFLSSNVSSIEQNVLKQNVDMCPKLFSRRVTSSRWSIVWWSKHLSRYCRWIPSKKMCAGTFELVMKMVARMKISILWKPTFPIESGDFWCLSPRFGVFDLVNEGGIQGDHLTKKKKWQVHPSHAPPHWRSVCLLGFKPFRRSSFTLPYSSPTFISFLDKITVEVSRLRATFLVRKYRDR